MARRRLIVVAAALASVTFGAAWWLSLDRLSPAEERLVGNWWHRDADSGEWSVMTLTPGRRYACARLGGPSRIVPPAGRWSVRGGQLVVDLEANPVRRGLRPLAGQRGVTVADVGAFPLASVTADEMVIAHVRGPRRTWTRTSTD
jgi:hypothetical protein